MNRTKTKAFTNFVSSIILLIFEVWTYYQTTSFRVHKRAYVQPATFPQIMIIGMMIFTLILFLQSFMKLIFGMKADDPDNEPCVSLRNRGTLGAIFVILLCVIYTYFFNELGYVLISAIISVIIMFQIGKRNFLMMLIVSVFVPLIMWLIFYKFLTVNIPMGLLQPLRELIDKI